MISWNRKTIWWPERPRVTAPRDSPHSQSFRDEKGATTQEGGAVSIQKENSQVSKIVCTLSLTVDTIAVGSFQAVISVTCVHVCVGACVRARVCGRVCVSDWTGGRFAFVHFLPKVKISTGHGGFTAGVWGTHPVAQRAP